MRVLLALLAAGLLIGCLGDPAGDAAATYGFEGVFMPLVSPAEALSIGDRVRAEGGEFTVEERVPPRFTAWGLTHAACDVVHAYAATLFFIDTMGGCEPAAITTVEPALMGVAPAVEGPVLASAPVGGEGW